MDTITEPTEGEAIVDEKLTPDQLQKWGDTAAMLQWTAPGFTHLFYRLLVTQHKEGHAVHGPVFSRKVPIAATDGENIILNPDTFFSMSLPERVWTICHEICHPMLDDLSAMKACVDRELVTSSDGSEMEYRHSTSNKAMDFRINDMITESRLGVMPTTILDPRTGKRREIKLCYDKTVGTQEDMWVDIYKKLYDDGDGGYDQIDVLLPGNINASGKPKKARNPANWAVEVAAARDMEERHRGTLPGGMAYFFKSILEPEIDWTEHVQGLFARKLGSSSTNWNRPNRRFIDHDFYLPSHSGYGCGWLVMWGDTSGSVSDAELERGFAEISGVVEDLRPKRLTVLWGDAELSYIDEITDAADLEHIKARGVGGRGGTDIMPALEWIANEGGNGEVPEMFMAFTDGELGGFPPEPPYPVLWANYRKGTVYPYGDVVDVTPKKGTT